MKYGTALYRGFDMRLRGCSALVQYAPDYGGQYRVQFDEVIPDPVMRPGVKAKPDHPEFRDLSRLPDPVHLCIGWHWFSQKDFPHVKWSDPLE